MCLPNLHWLSDVVSYLNLNKYQQFDHLKILVRCVCIYFQYYTVYLLFAVLQLGILFLYYYLFRYKKNVEMLKMMKVKPSFS